MKNIIFVLLLVFSSHLFAQELNKVIIDPKLEKEVLIGKCDREGLKSEVFAEYFNEGYNNYVPDANTIKQMKKRKKKKGISIVIVMGSWCGDSEEQVPKFYKILDEIGFKESKVELISVDGAKRAGDEDISGLNIQRVPTFFFYKDGREIGKIVETPTSSLEKDMLLIVSLN